MAPTPFTIDVSQEVLDDLRDRLARTRYPDTVMGAGWEYGMDLGYLREFVDYWRDGFDWRAQEAELNRFEHYRADIDGVGLHYIHRRSDNDDATAVMLLHGWPSSFVQMLNILPLLEDFHVVVPGLPGFGFSDRPTEAGMGVARVGELLVALMSELGYDRYAIRATDLGAGVAPVRR